MAKKSDVDIVSKVLAIPSGYATVRLQKKLHPTQKKVIDAVFSSSKEKVVFRTGNTCGKALSIETPILTLSGWKILDDIRVGDKVFGSDGRACSVTSVTETMYNRPCNRVVLSDGTELIADDDHLWKTTITIPLRKWNKSKREMEYLMNKEEVIMTTQNIRRSLNYVLSGGTSAHAHQIKLCQPLQYTPKELPLEPYTLGAWLGDGDSDSGRITHSKEKNEIVARIIKDGFSIMSSWKDKRCDVWCTSFVGLTKVLGELGVRNNKHIPQIYLESSEEQRTALLQGLMDTSDGCCDKRGRCEFCATNERLAYDVYDLILGLGIKATIHRNEAKLYGRFISYRWRITFIGNKKMNIFHLKSKINRLQDKKSNTARYVEGRMIKEIIPISSVPVKCIQVDSPDHCYLAGKNLIVTHNSSTVIPSVVLYAMEMKNALVIGTSATYRQIIEQTFMNIKKYSHLFPQWDFLENKIKINGETRLLFFSSDDEAQAQGWHATPDRPLLIIVDEPAGVSDEVFRAFERCQPTWILIAGSPLSPEGYFYKIETDEDIAKHFKHFKLTQPECAKSKGYWVDDSDIQLMLSSWGETHPLVLSSVYAEFSKDSENSIISLSNINAFYSHMPEYMPGERRVSIDFAAGGDSNCIVYRNGNMIKIVKIWKERDTMTAAGQILIELNKLKEQVGLRPQEVIGDASGLGLPIIHRLAELGWNIQLFYGQSKPNDENYRNLITECWLELAKKIVNKSIILPNDEDLKAQLLGRKQRLNSSGKLELESKEDMRSRGLSSPDIADAVAMCIINTNAGAVTSIKSLPITDMSRRSIGSYC